jgi:hypothetical protein
VESFPLASIFPPRPSCGSDELVGTTLLYLEKGMYRFEHVLKRTENRIDYILSGIVIVTGKDLLIHGFIQIDT